MVKPNDNIQNAYAKSIWVKCETKVWNIFGFWWNLLFAIDMEWNTWALDHAEHTRYTSVYAQLMSCLMCGSNRS